jgi:putative ABC transport system ATP-binding protein
MANLKDQGKTLLLASHDPVVFHSPVVDRVIELRYGRMVEEM